MTGMFKLNPPMLQVYRTRLYSLPELNSIENIRTSVFPIFIFCVLLIFLLLTRLAVCILMAN